MILLLACSISGLSLAYSLSSFNHFFYLTLFIGFVLGILFAILVIFIEKEIRKLPIKTVIGGLIGMLLGLLISMPIGLALNIFNRFPENSQVIGWIFLLIIIVFSYIGIALGSKKINEVNFFKDKVKGNEDIRILDTSVIIEGRIADICDSGFIEGNLIVPRFVLNELQLIADSSDSMKRLRGRRGLDILNHLQKNSHVNIEIVDYDFPKIKGVDGKLVALAKQLDGKLITNDYNLNKIAELQGIRVLNINELANAMKPVVLPGEQMTVKIVREGKEIGQGVAYLDDGTMIIVDNAQKLVNMNVKVTVTSVLQTTAGRMIFSEFKEVMN
jgi:uncharacterized protein YacL